MKKQHNMRTFSRIESGANKLWLFLVISISIAINLYLTNKGWLGGSVLLLTISAIVTCVLNLKSYLGHNKNSIWRAADKNAVEAQRLLQSKAFGIFKYATWKQVYGSDDLPSTSIQEAIETPVMWVLCIFLFAILFLSQAYSEFSFSSPHKILKLIFFSLLQILFLGMAFLGMFSLVAKKFNGSNK